MFGGPVLWRQGILSTKSAARDETGQISVSLSVFGWREGGEPILGLKGVSVGDDRVHAQNRFKLGSFRVIEGFGRASLEGF